MAVKTGPGAQRQTAVAKSVSDLGALMSAKADANTQPQPDIQVQAEVSVLPESTTTNLTGVASVSKEADIQSTPATAQSEQTTNEETMSKNETTQAQAQTYAYGYCAYKFKTARLRLGKTCAESKEHPYGGAVDHTNQCQRHHY